MVCTASSRPSVVSAMRWASVSAAWPLEPSWYVNVHVPFSLFYLFSHRVAAAAADTDSQTPLWRDDPTKAVMLDENSVLIEPEEIAAAMLQLVVDEKLGNGTIYEVTKGATRVVPAFNAPPPDGKGSMIAGYQATVDVLYDELKTKGLDV
ncbi:hypothetical protein G7046_g4808 [Stylonectria norvegica]|nr:hypothetical protein G7046_g4808 [Stylonectria norvegica]